MDRYYAHYDSRFPILFSQDAFLPKYNANKLLLWTILAIASRESDEHAHLYQLLVDPVRQLASDLYSSVSRSFETLQALLLLCAFPFPFRQTVNDPSPMYGALATQLAFQLGVHRPQFATDFTESRNVGDDPGDIARKKLWFGCVIINYLYEPFH
jgi:Fungal specific transcription factor domain